MAQGSPIGPVSPLARPAARRRRRRERLARRAIPVVLLAVAAFGAGALSGSRHVAPERAVAERFAAAWARGDHAAMHALLDPASRRRVSLKRFTRAYATAAATATLESVRVAGIASHPREDLAEIPMTAATKVFGTLRGTLSVRILRSEESAGVVWSRDLVFPGLRRGEKLQRAVEWPERGDLHARDGTPLAAGSLRASDLGPVAAEIAGRVGPIPPEQAAEYAERGYPPDANVGLSGLERQFEEHLAGRPGGTLRAGARVIARAEPRPARPLRTSIHPDAQRAAVEALAGRLGGVAVLRPHTGEVLALAGIAFSAPQPPGSTFKIITLAAALESGKAKPSDRFPVQTAATLEGVELENANGESCGGTLAESFAHSCNSVFAPLGARVGARRLVEAAERFGFNETPTIRGAQPSTIPAAGKIGDDLAVGSTAIGQGVVLATPLHLAGVAAAIANDGVYVRPTLLRGDRGRRTRATPAKVARHVDRMMRRVVSAGTGTAAAIEGVKVAGKTGTAELRDSTPEPEESPVPGETAVPVDDTTDTDAWFVAYAPASKPRIAVAVLLVGQGAGGETAAPAARVALLGALRAMRS